MSGRLPAVSRRRLVRVVPTPIRRLVRSLHPYRNPLSRLLASVQAPDGRVVFLQIGSNDGRENDPLRPLVLAQGWRGVLVEPLPEPFRRLTETYDGVEGLRLLRAAVADVDGTVPIYGVEPRPDDPSWVDQIGSLDREVVLSHWRAVPDLRSRLTATEVRAVRLGTLVSECELRRIDLMHTDVEGFDHHVLRQIDFAAPWAPRHLLYEHKHLTAVDAGDVESLLRRHGYRLWRLADDTFARRA